MKKSIFAALCAIATVVMTSCGGTEQTTDITLSVTPASVTLAVGGTQKLTAVSTPAQTTLKYIWASDNMEVATVSAAGVVTAVAEGTANITVTAEGAKAPATCVVTVSREAIFDLYKISDYGLFGTPEMIPGTDRYIHLVSGDSLYAQLGWINLFVWDEDLVFVSGSGFSGTGIMISAEVPVYWVNNDDGSQSYIGNQNGFFVDTCNNKIKPYTAEAGAMVDLQKYGQFWEQLYAYSKDTVNNPKPDAALYTAAQKGATMFINYADRGTQSYNVGLVEYANLLKKTDKETNETTFDYVANIKWYDYVNNDRVFGLKVNLTADGDVDSFVKPYDMRTIDRRYSTIEEGSATEAQYYIGDSKHLHLGEMPVINRNMDYTKLSHE